MGDVELFRLSTSTPDHTLVHGAAVLYGTADAHATFRRGIDIAAGFDIVGRAEASIGKELAFALTAGLDVTGTLAVQAAVPMDLFKAAGIIAKLHAEVGGDAYAAATLTLTRDLLKVKVLQQLPADLAPFATAVLDELELSAGLWARASFAAEVLGQASLTGALFGPQPGFTFDFRYDAALTFGAGTSFQVDMGLQDPDRMVGRLADAAASLLLAKCGMSGRPAPVLSGRAADQMLAALDPKDLAAAAANTLVPLGLRSVMGVGVSLLEPASTRVGKSLDAVAAGLLDQARHQLLAAAHDAAISALQAELTSLGWIRLAANITDAQRGQLAKAFDDLADAVDKVEGISTADAAVWLAAFAATLDPLDRILGFGFIPDAILKPITKAVAVLWSAAVVLGRVATVATSPAGADTGGLFPASPAQPPAPADVASLARPGGGAVTYADAISFLLRLADIDRLVVSAAPQFASVEAWLQRVLGTDATSLFVLLLSDLVAPSSAQNGQLVNLLGEVAADVMDNEIVPHLLTPLKTSHPADPAVAILVDDVAVPALTALPRVVLPALASGSNDDVAVRLRETLSAVVLHALNQTMIPTIRSLLQHALDNGEASLRKAADDEMTQGTASATHSLFDDFQSLFLSPDDIAGVLNLGADTLTNLHDHVLDPSVDLVSAVLDLGLGKDAEAALRALAASDDPPPAADIQGALDKVTSGAEHTLEVVIPEAEKLVKTYFEHFGDRIGVLLEDGIKVVYDAVKEVRDELLKDLAALQQLLSDVEALIGRLVGEIAADAHRLADQLRQEAETVRTSLRAQMINEITVATRGWPAWAQKAVIDLFTSLYDGLTFLPSMLEDALAGVLDDIADLLTAGVANSNGSRQAADDQVRGSAAAHCSQGMTFDLRVEVLGVTLFDLGTVRIAPGLVGTHVADTILGHAGYQAFMNTNLPKGQQIAQANSQAVAYQQRISGQVAQSEASQVLDSMVTGIDPTISIPAPAAGSSFTEGTAVILDIGGINATYLRSTLGVPPRVSIYLNGQPWYFTPDMWLDPGDHSQKLWAQVVAFARPPLPPAPVQSQQLAGNLTGSAHGSPAAAVDHSSGSASTIAPLASPVGPVRRPVTRGRTVLEHHDHVTAGLELILDPASLIGLSVGTDEHLARHAAAGTTPVQLQAPAGRSKRKATKKRAAGSTAKKVAPKRAASKKSSAATLGRGRTTMVSQRFSGASERQIQGPADLTGQLQPFALRGLLEAHQLAGVHPLAVATLTGRGVGGVDVDGPEDPPQYNPPHTGPTSPSFPTGPSPAPATPRGLPMLVGKFGVNNLTVVTTDGQGRTARAETTFTLAPAQTVALQNGATNLVLDVSGGQGATGDGTPVFTWPWLHGTNQLWTTTPEPPGTPGQPPVSTLVASHSGLALDVTGNPVQRAFTGQPGADVTLVPSNPGFVEITHPTRGLLTGDPAASRPGSPVVMAARKMDQAGQTAPEQQWRTVPTALFEAGTRYLVHARHSGRYLDVRLGETASWGDGATLQQWDLNRGPNQRFQLYETQPGEYLVFVEHSGRCLDAYFSGTANGTRVVVWNPHGGPNQRWRPEPTGGGWWRLVNVNSGLVLDVSGVDPANGALLQLWEWNGGQNQQWMFDADLDPDADVAGPLIAKHSGQVADVPGLSLEAGTTVQQWPSNGGANQRWRLRDAGNGAVTITAQHSGLLLRPGAVANGSPVLQMTAAGNDMDRWQVIPVEPGAARLVHVASGRVLDVTGGPTARSAGVGLQLYDWLSGDNQKWRLPR